MPVHWQGMHAVDVDLQAVIVDQKGVGVSGHRGCSLVGGLVGEDKVIIDAAYYNNMKALRSGASPCHAGT